MDHLQQEILYNLWLWHEADHVPSWNIAAMVIGANILITNISMIYVSDNDWGNWGPLGINDINKIYWR